MTVFPVIYLLRKGLAEVVVILVSVLQLLPLHRFHSFSSLLHRSLRQDFLKASVPQILQVSHVVVHAVLQFTQGGAFFVSARQLTEDVFDLLRKVLNEGLDLPLQRGIKVVGEFAVPHHVLERFGSVKKISRNLSISAD